MSRQNFLVKITERACRDSHEQAAMLRFRAKALDYRARLMDSGDLAYAFYLQDQPVGVHLAQVESNFELDRLIKRDPLFPYCSIQAIPVVDTEELILEAQEFLGESIIAATRAKELVHPLRRPDEDRSYVLVTKEVLPFSPLLPEAEQDEVFRRTVRSQNAHEDHDLEFADHNPVGQQIGILIGCGSESEIMVHVRHCEVFPDTVVSCEPLLTLRNAFEQCVSLLSELRRPAPSSDYFRRW